MNSSLPYSSHKEKIQLLTSGSLNLEENVRQFLESIEKTVRLNCFLQVYKEEAIARAQEVGKKIINGTAGKAAGMVVAIKDVLSIKDKVTTSGSTILSGFLPLYTATAVQRLINEDAIIIGKTNCDEFAMGSSNENSAFGKVLNPVDESCVPGGSSGGSAAAVAAGLCDAALGTDTGGSIRQPAAFCGIYGLKPTYSRVSRYGLTAFASSFDTIGPMTNSLYDLSLILELISGTDDKDATCSSIPVPNYSVNLASDKRFKVGIPREYFAAGLQREIRNKVEELKTFLSQQGHMVIDVDLPMTEYAIASYYVLITAEASSNLARYDGARYGFRAAKSGNLSEMYTQSRTEGFGNEVKRRIILGTYVLSSGYYDAYYAKAQKIRRLIKEDFDKTFREADIILTPTTPTTAFKLGAKSDNPLEMYLSDIYTTGANLAGIPGISIPLGNDERGLPIGIQFLSQQFNEENLLKFSNFVIQNFKS